MQSIAQTTAIDKLAELRQQRTRLEEAAAAILHAIDACSDRDLNGRLPVLESQGMRIDSQIEDLAPQIADAERDARIALLEGIIRRMDAAMVPGICFYCDRESRTDYAMPADEWRRLMLEAGV